MKKNGEIEYIKYYILSHRYEEALKALEIEIKKAITVSNSINIKQYIDLLPERIIINSPSLCANLAVLYSLKYEIEESKYWFNKLLEMKKNKNLVKNDKKLIEENILYCKISLPYFKQVNIIKHLKGLYNIMGDRYSIVQKMTMTGNQPSFLSGSKDFCSWTNHYLLLKVLMQPILERIFKDSAIGVADLGIAETLYQRNNLNDALIYTTTAIAEAEKNGIVDTLFVGYSLYSKIQFCLGNIKESPKILKEFKEKIGNEENYLMANYYANEARMNIQLQNKEEVEYWVYHTKADIKNSFNTLDRYQYLTQVRAYIFLEEYEKALYILDMMFNYIKEYGRTFYEIEYYILKAIIVYHLSNKDLAFENIEKALEIAQKYKFIRIFTEETYKLLSVMKDYSKMKHTKISDKYLADIIASMIDYANIDKMQKGILTKTEMIVIDLIEKGYTNDEISEKMHISKATVKTHINHIFAKLEVKNRTGAIREFKNLQK